MLTLKSQSTTEGLHSLVEAVIRIARSRGCTPKSANQLQLILEELLTNIRLYAYPEHPGPVELDVYPENPLEKNLFKFRLRDWGPAFDPSLEYASHHLEEGSLESRKIGGLGVYFVHSFSNSMEYHRLESEKGDLNSLELSLPLLGDGA